MECSVSSISIENCGYMARLPRLQTAAATMLVLVGNH